MNKFDLIYRDLYMPEWDLDMEEFFHAALVELKRYSDESGFTDSYPPAPETSERGYVYEIDLNEFS